MASPHFLELELHLANGRTHRFAQDDSQLAQLILDQIDSTVFTQSNLVIFGETLVCTYSGAALAGISLVMDPLPEELLHFATMPAGKSDRIVEITEEEYLVGCQYAQPLVEAETAAVFHEAELTNGHRFWLASHVTAAVSGWSERALVHHVFTGPPLGCLRRGGGLTLWNRAFLASYTFCPRPAVPTPAWPAERLPG